MFILNVVINFIKTVNDFTAKRHNPKVDNTIIAKGLIFLLK